MSPSSRPDRRAPGDAPDGPGSAPRCPFCGSTDVELEAPFGGSLMTRQFYCRGCRTVFERVKWDEEPGDAGDWLDA